MRPALFERRQSALVQYNYAYPFTFLIALSLMRTSRAVLYVNALFSLFDFHRRCFADLGFSLRVKVSVNPDPSSLLVRLKSTAPQQ